MSIPDGDAAPSIVSGRARTRVFTGHTWMKENDGDVLPLRWMLRVSCDSVALWFSTDDLTHESDDPAVIAYITALVPSLQLVSP